VEIGRIGREMGDALVDLPLALRRDDSGLADAARAALRRSLGRRLQKRPLVDVHLLRV
jgi:ribonuclease J